jgi:hypothetical protein
MRAAMDSDLQGATPENRDQVTKSWPSAVAVSKPANDVESGRGEEETNPIFENLVRVEGDIAGLVAYSIYKQNKRAWLQDFQKTVGRPPTDAEARSYIIGESTTRRLAIYRHLADATLAGQGPDTPADMGATKGVRPGRGRISVLSFILSAAVLVAAVALLFFVLRNGLTLSK